MQFENDNFLLKLILFSLSDNQLKKDYYCIKNPIHETKVLFSFTAFMFL